MRAARYGYMPGLPILDGLNATAGKALLQFSNGDLPPESTGERLVAILTTNQTLVSLPNTELLSIVVNPLTGMLTGSFTPVGSLPHKFKGVFYQKGAGCAYGFFLGTTQAGRVDLEPGGG